MTRNLIPMLVDMPVALDVLLKASLVLCLGWALHCALARSNPRWRVLLWRAVAAGVLLVPLLELIMPALKVTMPRESVAAVMMPIFSNPELMETAPAPLLTAPGAPANAPIQQAPRHSLLIAIKQHPWVLVSILWAGVSGLLALKLLFSLRGVRRLILSSAPVTGTIQELLHDLRGQLGVSRAVDLRASGEPSVPFLSGFRRPVIILPERMTQSDYAKELPAIFVHELVHLKGRDLPWILLMHTLAIALWFHPLAWRLRAAHAAACEAVCDAVAARHVGGSLVYSRTLARIALEQVALPPAVGGIAMARVPEVRRRVEALKRKIDDSPLARRWETTALISGAAVLSLITGIKLVSAATTGALEKKPARTVHFPETSLGRVYIWRDENASILCSNTWERGVHDRDFLPAKGDITVPAGKDVELRRVDIFYSING